MTTSTPLRLVAHHELRHPLEQRAARLYPTSPYLQREWLRAISVVRSTRLCWKLDKPIKRGEYRA